MQRIVPIILASILVSTGVSSAMAAALASVPPAPATAQPAPDAADIASPAYPGEDGRDTKALNMLEANGDIPFYNFQQAGKNFTADVNRGGQRVAVTVDPDSGLISRGG